MHLLILKTFLAAINATTVYVPIVTWNLKGQLSGGEDMKKNLSLITAYSMFKTELELLKQFENILATGSHIVIFNLRKVMN